MFPDFKELERKLWQGTSAALLILKDPNGSFITMTKYEYMTY